VEDFAVSDVLPTGPVASSVSDGMFVELHLARRTFKMKLYRGQAVKEPKLEQIPASALLRRKERHFLVTGEAGSGKSTLLRRLAFQMAERGLSDQLDIEIPVLLRAVDIFRSNQGIIEFCNETTSELSLSGKPAFTIDDLNIGRVTVFVDALDELSSNEERQEVLSKIAKFISSYPKCRVILTSRDYSFVTEFDELRQYVRFSLTPIDWKEAELIIKRLHKAKPIKEETAQELLRRLQDVHGIQLNPLLVTVFVATSDYSRRDIPANITELFKKFTEMMLGRWDAAKGLSQQYHAPLKDFLLTQLGFEMHRRRITSITLEECKRMLTNDLISRGRTADTDQLLKEIIDRSGMFRFIGDSVEFRHFLLQEFFAGRGAPSAEFLQSVISDEWWQRPMVFYFGENPSDHVSLESILENIDMRTEGEIFKAAIAVGLALQACYLIRTENRINIFEWVVRSLCAARNLILEETGTVRTRFPLTRFLGYYLFGRDAVACDVLRENTDRILAELQAGDIPSDENDLLVFWTIVGLIEGGHLEKAEELVKNFHPKDLRLSLAIHLGCFLIEKLRASTPLEKRLAKRICSYLDPTISHLRTQVLDEMKSQLLEVQKGQIQSIEFTNEKKRKKGETH
jgi:energy-coupling factor transporter ATP-binding protein EcfA2